MRLLLDHCLDWRLSRSIPGHEVKTVGQLEWGDLKDSALLEKAQNSFDVFITSDKNLPHQQNLHRFNLAVAILDVPSNRIEDCLPKIPELTKRLPLLKKRRATII